MGTEKSKYIGKSEEFFEGCLSALNSYSALTGDINSCPYAAGTAAYNEWVAGYNWECKILNF